MNYPDDFNVPNFAAGKSIAISRTMGIGIMSAFLVVLFLCGILVWTIRSVNVEPYILIPGGINDEWTVVRPGGDVPQYEMTAAQAVQQSLVWKFVQQWFTISNNGDVNANLWTDSCHRSDCDVDDATTPCQIFCTTGDDLFHRFRNNVLPTYEKYADAGEYWIPVTNSINITPVGGVNDVGGTWRVQMSVSIMGGKQMNILAYAKVAKNPKIHAGDFGYYIADFNAYRVTTNR